MSDHETTSSRRRFHSGLLRPVIVLAAIVAVLWVTGCMERLFYHPSPGPATPPAHLRDAESVWFNSADGTRLHGWFIPARSQDPASAAGPRLPLPPGEGGGEGAIEVPSVPTILHVHGNAGNVESHVGFTEHLPAAGFNLFIFDYRGYGQSAGTPRRRGPLIADTHAALDALLARDDLDPARLGLYGQSLGGSIALNVMADRPELRVAVIESAFASWRLMAANAVGGDPPNPLARALAAILIKDDRRPDEAIARVGRPILILHGTADSIIPVSHGRRLAAASNGHATLIELPGGDHNTLRYTNPEIEGMTIDFFRRHLTVDDARR
ncbi:MAG: alpha/beta fold hydrolase [Planctomycetes bacterium]|nr:alpha/beta fold hydrolase [Planctomycetota bacterium]